MAKIKVWVYVDVMSSQEDIIIDLRYNWLKVRQELHLLDQISLYSSTWEMKK